MKAKQVLIAFGAHGLLALGCFVFWCYLYFRFGGSLFDDVWLLIVGAILGFLALVELLLYRVIKRVEDTAKKQL